MTKLPQELEDYIQNLAPSSQNNSREIARRYFEKALSKHPLTRQRMLERWGIKLSDDYSESDEGEKPLKYN